MNEGIYSKIPQPFQNIGCQELLKEQYSHCGWVRKRHLASKLKLFRWPKVYMIISKGCVYYFRNEWANSQAGKFSLFGFNTVSRAAEIKEKEAMFAFKIEHVHKEEFKSYYFACSSESEMKNWMKIIRQELEIANNATRREGDYYYTQGFTPTKASLEQTPEAQGCSNDSGFGNSADGDSISVNFQQIEESIYDDPANFQPPEDYGMYAKRADEASDDEDIPDQPPPLPTRGAKGSGQGKKKHRHKKHRSKKRRTENEASNATVSSLPSDITKETANALASEMQGLLAKKKQVTREESFSLRQNIATLTRTETPPEEADDEDDASVCDDDENADEYWQSIYFEGEKDKASEIIRDIGENGVFLVRNSEDGGKVLVVFAQNMPKKYKIQTKDNQYFLAQSGPKADTLEDLLFEYFTLDLPNTTVKLTLPFQQHSHYK